MPAPLLLYRLRPGRDRGVFCGLGVVTLRLRRRCGWCRAAYVWCNFAAAKAMVEPVSPSGRLRPMAALYRGMSLVCDVRVVAGARRPRSLGRCLARACAFLVQD